MRLSPLPMLLAVACLSCIVIGTPLSGGEAVTVGQDRAKQVNDFNSKSLRPLFDCFSSAWSRARSATSSSDADRIGRDIAACRQQGSLGSVAMAPDGESEGIRTRLNSLLGALHGKVATLADQLRQHERAMQEPVESIKNPTGEGTLYRRTDRDTAQASGLDPRRRYEPMIANTKVEIQNLGAEFENLKQRVTKWVERVQQEIDLETRRQQQMNK